jgi:hypothetical protein
VVFSHQFIGQVFRDHCPLDPWRAIAGIVDDFGKTSFRRISRYVKVEFCDWGDVRYSLAMSPAAYVQQSIVGSCA